MPRKAVVPASVANALTAPKPPTAPARAVAVLSGQPDTVSIADKDVETLTAEVVALQANCGEAILEIGKRLIVVKDKLPHGDWLPWLERVGISKRLAQRFMQLAREWANASTLTHLGMSKALSLLALPEPVRDEFITESHVVDGQEKSVSEMSARELADAIKARQEAESAVKSLRERLAEVERDSNQVRGELANARNMLDATQTERDKARDLLTQATEELSQLKNKPVEVSVEKVVDQDAVEKARQEIRASLQSEIDGLKKDNSQYKRDVKHVSEQMSIVQNQAKEAQQKAEDLQHDLEVSESDAQAAKQELERVQAEVVRLRKNAPLADKDLSLFGVLFEQVQASVNQMHGIALKQPDEKRDMLKKSLSALADSVRKAADEL